MAAQFPARVYTVEEVETARKLIAAGYKHRLTISGSDPFKQSATKAVEHVKTAGFYDFLRTYIRRVIEINGFSQLRETDAAIWANTQLLENPIEAAGFFVQKAFQMKEFVEGKLYYGGKAEARSVEKRIKFLNALQARSTSPTVKTECAKRLQRWAESTFVF
jgi:hypothetical protein